MTDGAHLGLGAQEAMQAIVGGDEEDVRDANENPDRHRTPAQMRAYLEANAQPHTYDGCANAAALILLRLYEQRPEARDWPVERPVAGWRRKDTGESVEGAHLPPEWRRLRLVDIEAVYADVPDLYAELKAFANDWECEHVLKGLTGFMFGWSVNAARYCLELPPEPNPAIMTVTM